MKEVAQRLGLIPPYLFKTIADAKHSYQGELFDFGEGDPDQPTPAHIVEAMAAAVRDPATHRYPGYDGMLATRQAIAAWYQERFGVVLDPATEVCVLVGSKEGVAHLVWALVDPGDEVLVPDPAYPVAFNQVLLAGGTPRPMPLRAEHDFLPDLDALTGLDRVKVMFLNYPSNPTAACAPLEFYTRAVEQADRHGFFIVNDNVYSELYYADRPVSLLQVPGARDLGVEFNSLSKTFNMTGWRVGYCVGSARALRALLAVKTNVDSGVFEAVQRAAITALTGSQDCTAQLRLAYRERRDLLCAGLARLGWEFRVPAATFYVWARVPTEEDSVQFARRLLTETGVVVMPGRGFGPSGEGYVRFALTLPAEKISRALSRLPRR